MTRTRRRASTRSAVLALLALVAALSGGLVTSHPAGAYGISGDTVVVPMCFPFPTKVSVANTWGAPRSGGRTHEGIDVFAAKGTPVVAADDGVVTFLYTNAALSGRGIGIKDAQGWQYAYVHLNNDNPGTDDGAAPLSAGILSGLRVGDRVLRGQVIGWVGDSGNAETTPSHTHFELKQTFNDADPDNDVKYNPYESLIRAQPCRPAPVGRSIAVNPNGGTYTLTGTGHIVAVGAPHFGEPTFSTDIARDLAVMPDGRGYVVLDGYGGIHRYGSAVAALEPLRFDSPYWPGYDIARSLAITADGAGYAVLDGWGAVHVVGSAVPALDGVRSSGPYWPGQDVARSLALMPDGAGYVVMDWFGAVHRVGSAVESLAGVVHRGYWPGWDVARDLALDRSGAGYAVLDAWGALHVSGQFPLGSAGLSYGPSQPSWRSVALGTSKVHAVRIDGLVQRSDSFD